MSFISDYLEQTKFYESPTSFWKWSGYATISAVLRDNVYHKQSSIYPNIFVMFLAKSGERKGRPVQLSEKMVKAINNTKVISGRSSIQAIVAELARSETNKDTGKLLKGGSAIFFAPELSAAIVGDSQNIPILTDIYDYKDDYDNILIGRGKQTISKVVFSILSASNEDLLRSIYEHSAVHGGLLARTFIVAPSEWRPSVSLLDFETTSDDILKIVLPNLKKISELKGCISTDDCAKHEYNTWYKDFRESSRTKADKTGVLNRLPTGVFKLAIILAANDLTTVLKKCHMECAIEECLDLIPNYSVFTMSSGKSENAEAGVILLGELYKAKGPVSRSEIMRNHWSDFSSDVLEELVVTLETGGIIKTVDMEGRPGYKLTDLGMEYMEGKK